MYRQLITPDLTPTIYENGVVLNDWYGWCLAYVQYAFGTGWSGSTATDCWNNHTINRHENNDLPSGVWVPIFFSGYGGMGHAAIYKDGVVYSSPWHHKAAFDEVASIAETARIYNVTFVGWAEGIAGKQVIEMVADQPTPIVHPYTIESIPPKQVKTNKQPTYKWGMNYDNIPAICNNPEGQVNEGTTLSITAICHHNVGYSYYLEDASIPSGYNILDCDDVSIPSTYTPPAAPVEATPPETYQLVTTLPFYNSSTDCQNGQNSKGDLPEGKYYVWGKEGANNIYWNLGPTNTTQPQQWVNILDNKIPVVIDPPVSTPALVISTPPSMGESEIRASYRAISSGPIDVQAKQNILVADIVGRGNPITIKKGSTFHIYGTFRKNNQWYAMPKIKMTNSSANDFMYGIPITNTNTLEPYLEDIFGFPEQLRTVAQAWYDKTVATIEGVFKPKRKQ